MKNFGYRVSFDECSKRKEYEDAYTKYEDAYTKVCRSCCKDDLSSFSLTSNRIEIAIYIYIASTLEHIYDTEIFPSFQQPNAPTCAGRFACVATDI